MCRDCGAILNHVVLTEQTLLIGTYVIVLGMAAGQYHDASVVADVAAILCGLLAITLYRRQQTWMRRLWAALIWVGLVLVAIQMPTVLWH